jgi:hypothetical protein
MDEQLQSDQNSTFAYSSSAGSQGTHSVTATVTDSYGTTSPLSSPATVTVNDALIAPTVMPSHLTVDQGQTSTLSNITIISTGTSPYTYQWFEKSPGNSYVTVGSSSTCYNFSTNSSTATGIWSFILRVTDNAGATANSTEIAVLVNSALAAPILTSTAPMIYQSKTSVLSNCTMINTGTPSYSYQWLEETPGASIYFAISGATLTTYNFITSTSTTIGVWHFKLCVTDATGAIVTSDIVTVTVNARPGCGAGYQAKLE